MSACALCGTPAPPPFRAPQPQFAPDLDGRPGEPARSTLPRWVQRCGGCGACAPDLSQLPAPAAAITQTAAYRATRSRFQRWAALAQGGDAAEAWLQAAWEAEDAGQDGSALRRRALAAWPDPDTPEGMLRLADIARRAGQFAEATAWLDRLPAETSPEGQGIAAFQRGCIAAADPGRQLLSNALRPPARKPHVAHGPAKPANHRGFWARLFGR